MKLQNFFPLPSPPEGLDTIEVKLMGGDAIICSHQETKDTCENAPNFVSQLPDELWEAEGIDTPPVCPNMCSWTA